MLINKIEQNVIGKNRLFPTSFGQKPLVYADYTASGRGLVFIEDYIAQHVLPWYANTHTETSFTGAQTTRFREEARHIIRNAVNGSQQDKVIFCGSGATAAVDKLIDILGLRIPNDLDKQHSLLEHIPEANKPVVFIGPYEHHSNELPWRESIADVVTIPLNSEGKICCQSLETQLKIFAKRPYKIGSFSAASNVTGVRSDIQKITALLKTHGALSFWDYAAAGPYVTIDMNNSAPIDAVFLSPHKFIGGPGTPGVLVAKASLFKNTVPAVVGGGTVVYVTPENHDFVKDPERKEEGGTPAIVESIRAGLVFKLQQDVGTDVIEEREHLLVKEAMAFFATLPQVDVLGPTDTDRLSIFSLRFKHLDKDLHYGFITSLFNDLFGIQVRGGCSCAGPYGHTLLGMDKEYSRSLEQEIKAGNMVLRPGWVRLNFNYFISKNEFNYLLRAIKLIAEYGWKLLPFYKLDEKNAIWRFQGESDLHKSSLNDVDFDDINIDRQKTASPDFDCLLNDAEITINMNKSHWQRYTLSLSPKAEALRWFVLPQDVEPNAQLLAAS